MTVPSAGHLTPRLTSCYNSVIGRFAARSSAGDARPAGLLPPHDVHRENARHTNSLTQVTKSTNLYIHSRVTQTLAASLKDHAEKNDRSLSYVIRQALEEYLQARGYSNFD